MSEGMRRDVLTEPTISLAQAKRSRRKHALGEIDESLPVVRVIPGEAPRVVDEAEAALVRSAQGLYQRGGTIVRPYLDEVPAANGRKTLSYRMGRPSVAHVAECLTRAANFVKYDARVSDFVRIDCPRDVAEALVAREGQWKFPRLRGVITAPTLRGDGSVFDRAGYDQATALIFDPCGANFPEVAHAPTRDDGAAALRVLNDLLGNYPFVDRESKAVALSGIATAVIRRSIGTAPLHAFTANAPGAGKTHAVDLCSMVATGQLAAAISQARNEEESEKRLAAALIAGDALINIDNCTRELGGNQLCVALTQETIRIRILGLSQNVEIPSDALIFATGNNLAIGDDMSRRVLICALDPQNERPELREFHTDPIAVVRRERGKYVTAVLTMLRAFHLAGRPQLRPALGSFSEWSLLVRNALIWLGEADPAETMEQARAADIKLRTLATVMEQWEAIPVLAERKKTASEIIAIANEEERAADGALHPRYGDFRDALLAVAAEGHASISTRRLGKWFMANQGRVLKGRRIVQAGQRGGVALWLLEMVESG